MTELEQLKTVLSVVDTTAIATALNLLRANDFAVLRYLENGHHPNCDELAFAAGGCCCGYDDAMQSVKEVLK